MKLIGLQGQQERSSITSKTLQITLTSTYTMASDDGHSLVALHFEEFCQNMRTRVSRTTCESIQQVLFPCYLDHDSHGCRVLDGDEDQKEMAP
jgi:hypothetical protein